MESIYIYIMCYSILGVVSKLWVDHSLKFSSRGDNNILINKMSLQVTLFHKDIGRKGI